MILAIGMALLRERLIANMAYAPMILQSVQLELLSQRSEDESSQQFCQRY